MKKTIFIFCLISLFDVNLTYAKSVRLENVIIPTFFTSKAVVVQDGFGDEYTLRPSSVVQTEDFQRIPNVWVVTLKTLPRHVVKFDLKDKAELLDTIRVYSRFGQGGAVTALDKNRRELYSHVL